MKKKIFYTILICIIIAGAIVIGTMGLKADVVYSKSIRIDVYVGEVFDSDEIEQMVKEVFDTDRIIIQEVEYFGDTFTLTISQDEENVDEKVEQLASEINEAYELEEDDEVDYEIIYQPKIKLSSIVTHYILPFAICIIVVLIYAVIRYRKLGVLKTLALYILPLLASEALELSIIAICRIPVNRLVVPIGLIIYIVVITVVTVLQEKKLAGYSAETKKKK